MRSLTPAEAAVIRSLLADEPVPHRERIQRSGLPARTYEVARQRLLAAGWLVERYLPDPVRLGRPSATIAILRPFAEEFRAVARRWREDPDTVFLWEGPELIVGVAIPREDGRARVPRPPAPGRGTVLTLDLRRPTFAVYFDFEGAWARLSGERGTYRYPRPLAPNGGGPDGNGRASPRELDFLTEIVNRPMVPDGARRTGWFASRRVRQLFTSGAVEHRVFLDVTVVPSYREQQASTVVLLHGELRAGAAPDRLFRELVGGCRVTPFLFATDETSVLIGALAPAPAATSSEGRMAVLPVLQRSLQGIEVTRVPATDLATTVNHRYDRLVAAPGDAA